MRAQAAEERPWHAHWPEGIPKALDYPDIPVHELLRLAARRYPDRTAVRFFGKSTSYREVDAASDRFATGLRKIGVRAGERVSLLLPNTPHFLVTFFGVLRAGGVVVQTSPLYTPRELEKLYDDTGVETIVALDLFLHHVEKRGTGAQRVIVCDIAEFLRTPLRQLYAIKKRKDLKETDHWPLVIPDEPRIHRFPDLVATPPVPSEEPPAAPDDVAVLQPTGGTTGIPKAAMLTHRNVVANAMQTAAWLPERGLQERVLGAIPLFHVYGLVAVMLSSIVRGSEVVLHPDPRDIDRILKLINRTRPTVFPGVPTMYIAILRHPKLAKYHLKSIRWCVSGAAPLPSEVRLQFERATGGRIVEGYGLTEASPATHANPFGGLVKEGIGIPLPDTDAKIVDPEDSGKELTQGEVGELAVRGPQVMKGYWNSPEETARVLRDGWLLTGDLATMDEEGYFCIVDRKKDTIIASGYKIYPREVEEVIFMHPAVVEVAVIGVPDPYRGEAAKAFVIPKPGTTATEGEIIAFCKERLAAFKVPDQVEFVKDLPRSLIGKVLRRELRKLELAKITTAG